MKIAIIIPAYNEASVIAQTLADLRQVASRRKNHHLDLVVVDDGSQDRTADEAERRADFVLRHRRNCGLGAALATGFRFCREQGYDAVITFDADGQHDPADLQLAIASLESGADVVIGSRFLGKTTNLVASRRFILKLSNIVTFIFFGIWTSDSQSGFRALGRRALNLLELKSNRMEVSSEFFGEIKRHHLNLAEIPIHIRYTPYSLRKGQKNSSSFLILLKLFYNLFR